VFPLRNQFEHIGIFHWPRLKPNLTTVLILTTTVLLLAGSNAHAQRWPAERAIGDFVCHADFDLAEAAVLGDLSVLRRDVTATLAAKEVRRPIHLFLFESQPAYQAYLTRHFPEAPYRRALFIKAGGPGMVFAFRGPNFDIDVRHEATHAVIHSYLPTLPLWLDEGLAEYFEVAPSDQATNNPHLFAVQWNIRHAGVKKLEQLEKLTALNQMQSVDYRHSWAWVHFMLHGPPAAKEELNSYLQALHDKVPTAPLSRRLRHRFPDLDRQLVQHFDNQRGKSQSATAPGSSPEKKY